MILVIIGSQESVAGALSWTSPFDTYEGYYMAGPPPGSYLSDCYVVTMNGSWDGAAVASLNPQLNSISGCEGGYVAVVFKIPGGIGESAAQFVPANTSLQVTGPVGDSDIGGSFSACNIYGYCLAWATSWLGGSSAEPSVLSGDSFVASFAKQVSADLPAPLLSESLAREWSVQFRHLSHCMKSHGDQPFPVVPKGFGNGKSRIPLIEVDPGFQLAVGRCDADFVKVAILTSADFRD